MATRADLVKLERMIFALILLGAFALGCALAIRRLNGYVWAGLFFGEPIAAVIAYQIINPDPGCTYDCPGQLGWGFILLFATLGWWAGLIAGPMIGYSGSRGPLRVTDYREGGASL